MVLTKMIKLKCRYTTNAVLYLQVNYDVEYCAVTLMLRNIANKRMTQCYSDDGCIEATTKGREGLQFEINLISKSPGNVKKCEEQFYFDVSLE